MATTEDILGRKPTAKELNALCDSLENITRPKRWRHCTIEQLVGADYALRMFMTSPVLRGEARLQCADLVNEIRREINARPEECEEYNKSCKENTKDFEM